MIIPCSFGFIPITSSLSLAPVEHNCFEVAISQLNPPPVCLLHHPAAAYLCLVRPVQQLCAEINLTKPCR